MYKAHKQMTIIFHLQLFISVTSIYVFQVEMHAKECTKYRDDGDFHISIV